MGELVDGVWHAGSLVRDKPGAFQRAPTKFHGRITPRAEAGRYHLYVSYACPWAHRTLMVRALRGLEQIIGVTVVDAKMAEDGWAFSKDEPDPLGPSQFLRDVYVRADATYTGRVTVPVLWDRHTAAIVNNESREIMRMIDTELEGGPTLAPPALLADIDHVLDAIYTPINNGVYRAGFATTQEAYEQACTEVFDALDHWDGVLAKQRYLCGSVLTEADIALFSTLIRFDTAYYSHFKCNIRRIQDYPNLWGYVRDIYQIPEIKKTCRLDQIKLHYFWSHPHINPTRIVPLGPTIDLEGKHDRARF
jgi:putative glutathione S-transferase